jgi:ABC-type dipeptide/oligopeptide/nickel transport system permease component
MTGIVPFVVRRLLAAIPVLLIVTAGTFWLGRYAPGDPVTVRTGGKATPEAVARLRHQLHLDESVPQQYVRYMGNLLRGDLGESFRRQNRKVSEIIFPKMWVSVQENIYPFFLTFLIGMPIGIYLALRRGRWQDPTVTAGLLVLSAIPVVLAIPVLQVVFAVKLKLLPVGGWHGIFAKNVILPTIVLTVPAFAGIARLMRISVLQVLDDEYVRTARAKGLSERVVVYRHVLRNAMLPIVTAIVTSLFFLFTGSFFVETLFGIPGIAAESIASVGSRDYDEIMAITLFGAVAFIAANIALDIIYTFVDPRVRLDAS